MSSTSQGATARSRLALSTCRTARAPVSSRIFPAAFTAIRRLSDGDAVGVPESRRIDRLDHATLGREMLAAGPGESAYLHGLAGRRPTAGPEYPPGLPG